MVRLVAILLVAFLVGRRALLGPLRALLLIMESFPQAPFKLLRLITPQPMHYQVPLPGALPTIVADVFLPMPGLQVIHSHSLPAVMLCAGVKTKPVDRDVIFHLAETLARLGYVVIWPRLEPMDHGVALLEEANTFVAAFELLERLEVVDRGRISLLGFSVGGAIALVAAADERIASRVHSVTCFGGYCDIFEYLTALVVHDTILDGTTVRWTGDDGAVTHVRDVLAERGAVHLSALFTARTRADVDQVLRSCPEWELAGLRAANPATCLTRLRAPVFILHDRGDHYVPYTESVRLSQALPANIEHHLLLVDMFEHTQPRRALGVSMLRDFGRFYGFLARVLRAL